MKASEALTKAKELLSALARRRGEVGQIAEKILGLLRHLDSRLDSSAEMVARQSKRGSGQVEYRVERTSAGETLAEHRSSGSSQPFRCPRPLYDALVAVMASAGRPMSLDELSAAVEG